MQEAEYRPGMCEHERTGEIKRRSNGKDREGSRTRGKESRQQAAG